MMQTFKRGELQKGDRVALKVTTGGSVYWDESVVEDVYALPNGDEVVELSYGVLGLGYTWKGNGYFLNVPGGTAQLYPWTLETQQLVEAQ